MQLHLRETCKQSGNKGKSGPFWDPFYTDREGELEEGDICQRMNHTIQEEKGRDFEGSH